MVLGTWGRLDLSPLLERCILLTEYLTFSSMSVLRI